MKASKINTISATLMMFFISILSTSCSEDKKIEDASTKIEAPEMDIHTAVLANNLEVVRQHIEAGTDINSKEPFNGATPLISAATFGKIEIAKALIDAGADLSIKNQDGSTPLHSAAFFGRVEIVQLLLEADADKSIINNYGATARETVAGPFEEIKPVYEMMKQQLEPLGLQLDMTELEKSRPVIAMMLQ
ncbi:ankyrin repeat domain-containing protein [Algoriphagus sp. PAP.12]|uniref:ankyrin repeat domain-containing protein n=1 Tax=Algoriphagus sp. PAP.12 TaxID=2996678 RepID=UPI00227D5747|nr:ankyrin repeat domain-containing protein [Algoriphagus sp. PAP.12]